MKREFELLSQAQDADFEWRKKTTELLGQVYIHLNRTRLAFKNKYSQLEKYEEVYEDEVIFTSNRKIRDLLLDNGHHLPPDLLEQASLLIEHFDVWLNKYHNLRKVEHNKSIVQIYVGPDGFRFPDKAEELFKIKYIELFNEIRTVKAEHKYQSILVITYCFAIIDMAVVKIPARHPIYFSPNMLTTAGLKAIIQKSHMPGNV